jgi:hypothetical protein
LGSGEVSVQAGGNVTNLSAAVADSVATSSTTAGALVSSAGGNLSVRAGGDVGSPYLYVANGLGRVQAGGAISATRQDINGNPLGAMLMTGDSSFVLSARGGILLEGAEQASLLYVTGLTGAHVPPFFYRYGSNSALSVSSTGGNITFNSGANLLDYVEDSVAGNAPLTDIVPATLQFSSYSGDVTLSGLTYTFPSANGQFSVVAAHDVKTAGSMQFGMSDELISLVPTPTATTTDLPNTIVNTTTSASASLHANDPVPALVSAGDDITGVWLLTSKPATITAGHDVAELILNAQNLRPEDITLISAGHDITYTTDPTSPNFSPSDSIVVQGPGHVELLAGGNINFGYSVGVTSVGNLENPNLANSSGASIIALAGRGAPLGVDSDFTSGDHDFVSDVIGASSVYQQQLESYVSQLTGNPYNSFEAAAMAFRGLSEAQQLPLLTSIFFSELILSGQEANSTPGLGFTRGYAAIDSLFPDSRTTASPYAGDLSLDASRIYTLEGGSISLLVPGGGVDVGLATLPPALTQLNIVRNPSDLGVVAVAAGDVQIFANNDVLVNSSRVFTLGGGNIAIWSTVGNIDAGRGAKSSLSVPPPITTVNDAGVVTVDFSSTVAGSGIRTIEAGPGVTPGNVDLMAPNGFVNAGDAGIGASGNLNIAAQSVLGASNIQVGGTSTGVPPEVSGLGAALSGASAAGSATTNAATSSVTESAGAQNSATTVAQSTLGWLDVFVEGFGEEVCKPADVECLKRQAQGHAH